MPKEVLVVITGLVASPASAVVLVCASTGGAACDNVAVVEAGVEGVALLGADAGKCVASIAIIFWIRHGCRGRVRAS